MIVIVILLVLAAIPGAMIGNRYFAPFHKGNSRKYDPSHFEADPDSPLKGKVIYCLGSSVTVGLSSRYVSFTDYLEKVDGCRFIVEAVSGSTMADRGWLSYPARLSRNKVLDKKIDVVLIQLSSNDATFGSDLGEVSDSMDPADWDTHTTAGGMEWLIHYCKEHFDVPLVFYTCAKYDNPRYHQMVNFLLDLQEKWDFEIIDLWHDRKFNQVSEEEYHLYMNDGVHPTKAGYALWWGPAIRAGLVRALNQKQKGK